MTTDKDIEFQVRIRLLEEKDRSMEHSLSIKLLEKSVNDIKRIGFWLLGTLIVGVVIPISLHSFGVV